jgi:uncharacterized protein YggE
MVVALFGATTMAAAQPAGQGGASASAGSATTHLHLSASASVSVVPDLLVADLAAQASSPSAAVAQEKVNALMARGLAEAKAVDGVDARAIGYSVQQVELGGQIAGARAAPRRVEWNAQQTLELRASAGDRLLELVGTLQGQGFAASGIDWQLSPEQERKAHDAAMVEALHALRARADAAAAALGLHVDRLADVQVDNPQVFPVQPMMAAAAAAPMVSPPVVTQSEQRMTSQVTADVALRP